MKSVPIKVYIKGRPEPEDAGWQLGIWGRSSKSINKNEIWGLAIDGWPTQMCYGFDYANPWFGIRNRKERFKNDPDEDWLYWFFDVGRKITVKLDDLGAALQKLGFEENYEGT